MQDTNPCALASCALDFEVHLQGRQPSIRAAKLEHDLHTCRSFYTPHCRLDPAQRRGSSAFDRWPDLSLEQNVATWQHSRLTLTITPMGTFSLLMFSPPPSAPSSAIPLSDYHATHSLSRKAGLLRVLSTGRRVSAAKQP